MLSQQKTGPVRKRGERVKYGKLMVDPPAQKADPHNQRGIDPQQRLLEIRAGLFFHAMLPRGRDTGQKRLRDRVKIADQRLKRLIFRQNEVGTPVGGHAEGRQL